ncbi:MAG: multicopper oxidase family protein [Pelagimonas sp.]
MKRRAFLCGSGAAMAAGAGGLGAGLTWPQLGQAAALSHDLTIQPARYALRDGVMTDGLVSLSADAPPPVIRGKKGVPMRLNVTNAMPDYTAMHWHGLRIPNGMDGVPYLTQFPIAEGETFAYEFTPPDAGTYWYHPHCMTMSQMAHGLTGVMVIDEESDPGFDGDEVVSLRDFRLQDDGSFLPYFTPRGAARSGTFGNVQTANWLQEPVYDHPAGGLVRLRVVNTDTTRIYKLVLSGAEAKIIAWDGHPTRIDVPMPTAEDPMLLGPGQRADFAVRMPSGEGKQVDLLAQLPGYVTKPMARLRAIGADLNRSLSDLAPLEDNPVNLPNLDQAELHEFVFGWTPEGDAPNDGLCGTLGYSFWSINRTPWAGDAAENVGPLATLERGKSYVLRLRNESPNLHPIHLHGLVFVPLKSNQRDLPPLLTDTMLLLKDEVIDIALVADNPGDWAFHCHVIEHQKTGLAGYIRVT